MGGALNKFLNFPISGNQTLLDILLFAFLIDQNPSHDPLNKNYGAFADDIIK